MSSFTPPPSYQAGGPPGIVVQPAHPARVTLASLLGILWALIGLVVLLGTVYVVMLNPNFDHRVIQEVRTRTVRADDTTLFNYLLMSAVPGTVAALVLLVGSAAALGRKEWGRRWMILAAVLQILVAIANGVMIGREYHHSNDRSVLTFGLVVVGVQLLVPLLILLLVSGKRARAAFAPGRTDLSASA